MDVAHFLQGQLYRRRDLHARWGGQRQGGISTPREHNLILIFSGSSGQRHGYHDQWTSEGLFFYVGEGQDGDMRFVAGNRAIRDHIANGKDLHLFEQARKGHVRYVGQMVCTGWHFINATDTRGSDRKAIVFELAQMDELGTEQNATVDESKELEKASLAQLRAKALADSAYARTPAQRKTLWRRRSQAIRLYVFRRANGRCEGCEAPAPFRTSRGEPYLEPHHIRRLSDGGPDHPRWVVAICPNCHRHAHHAEDAAQFNKRLSDIAGRLESAEV